MPSLNYSLGQVGGSPLPIGCCAQSNRLRTVLHPNYQAFILLYLKRSNRCIEDHFAIN